MKNTKSNENEFCARCGIDLFLPGVEPKERNGRVYCEVCAAKLDEPAPEKKDKGEEQRKEIDRFSKFMTGKSLLIPLDGAYMRWSRNIEADKATGQLWLVHSRSVGGRGVSFASVSVDVFEEEPVMLTAQEALRLAEEAHPGVSEVFEGLTDTNGAEYIGRYTAWAQDQSRFEGCGPMKEQIKADFRKLGIPISETLIHYGAPLYFCYDEKTGKYTVQEPAERSSGYLTLFSDRNRDKFRWFLLEYIVRVWADREERNRTGELQKAWRWPVPYDSRVPEKEMALQKLCLVYPADSDEILGYAARILQTLNHGEARIVRWMLDPDTMTLYMPAEKHQYIRDLLAEKSLLEDRLQKGEKVPGAAVIRQRLKELDLAALFLDAGPDMAAQLIADVKKLGFTAEQVEKALPGRFGHGAAGYWAEDVEEDREKTFTYPVCMQASAEDFRFLIVERIVRFNVQWPQLHSAAQFSLWVRRLMRIFSRTEIQNKTHTFVTEPQMQTYIDEKIALLEKSSPEYDWALNSRKDWLVGTPKAGEAVRPLENPKAPERGSKFGAELHLYGDPSGHGTQIWAGKVTEGPQAGRYFWRVLDDGYPNRTAGGGFDELLPKGLVQDGRVLQQELFRWICEIWPHASGLSEDHDAIVLDLDRGKKIYPAENRVSEDGFLWAVDNGMAVILGWQGTAETLVIPGMLDGYPVREILPDAFCGKPLQTVEIPRIVRAVGSHAIGYSRTAGGAYRLLDPKPTVRGYRWTAAERYAKENDLPFEDLYPNTNGKVRQGQITEVGKTVTAEVYPSEEAKHWHSVSGGSTAGTFENAGKPVQPAQKPKPKTDWAMIGMACFLGIMAVVAFCAKGWLLGAVFGVIAVLMPVSVYLDRKKEEQRREKREQRNRNR